MNSYIATFFTHYDAVVFLKNIKALGMKGECVPVPRAMSSSCGTAVCFKADSCTALKLISGDIEQLAILNGGEYRLIADNR